ncbi:MAG: siphovirus ReqiPepy6 Gp37-like family protein [Oscillospiraceae bacterium]|jgi:hypothetical protein|nr:siphovirus ReqiPepy6 Gp37-like family protein [Oscillospiraceae bacterium]
MEMYVFNPQLERIGLVEAFEYLRWTRRYSTCGGFELKAPLHPENAAMLQIGNILWKNDDPEAGIIEYLELSMADRETIVVRGRFATALLARRIIWNTELLAGDLGDCVGQLLERHLINPADANRKISGITYTAASTGIAVNSQVSYKNLLDTVVGLCEAADMGIRTVFDPAAKMFTVSLYAGTKTAAVFSREFENISEQSFAQSVTDYANAALVGSEGEGEERTMIAIGDTAGLDRYELFVDAKDLRSEDFPDDYDAALEFRGNAKITEQAMVKAFDASVHPYGNLKYKQDFDLGDVVTVISKAWNVGMTTRITEIAESYDSGGMSLDITFGKPLATLTKRLKEASL